MYAYSPRRTIALGLVLAFVLLSTMLAPTASATTPVGTSVVTWGDDLDNLNLHAPPDLGKVTAVATGFEHTVALLSDGNVRVWGNRKRYFSSPGLYGTVDIDAGPSHSVARRNDGWIIIWGSWGSTTDYRGFQKSLYIKHGFSDVDAGCNHNVAVSNGYVVSLPLDVRIADYDVVDLEDLKYTYVPQEISKFHNAGASTGDVIAVSAWCNDNAALKSDGTVIAWEEGSGKLLPVPETVRNIKAISVGADYIDALTQDGTVISWGRGGELRTVPSNLQGLTKISAGLAHSVGLKNDGTVVTWGVDWSNAGILTVPANVRNVQAIAAGYSHTVVVKENHAPAAQPNNYYAAQNGQVEFLSISSDGVDDRLLANDSDADGDTLTAKLIQAPTNGTVTVYPDGGFRYTPNLRFSGRDSFTYAAFDGAVHSAPVTVTIDVQADGG